MDRIGNRGRHRLLPG